MKKGWLVRSVYFAVAQVIVGGVVLFIIYGYLLRELGADLLGVWATVLGVSSISRISELGLSAGMVKFVSQYLEKDDYQSAKLAIQTAMISVGLLFSMVLIALYPAVEWILRKAISGLMIPYALDVLPWAMFSVWLLSLGGIVTGALDGCGRIDLRSLLTMSAQIAYLLLVLVLTPAFGLIGVAYAQIIQSSMLLVMAWLVIRRSMAGLPVIPYQWRVGVFKNLLGYGAKFQYTTIMTMLFDPITKLLLSRYGGVASVGYYEMANRMVGQIRTLIVEGNRVLVPVLARVDSKDVNKLSRLSDESYELLFFIAIPTFAIIALLSPLICIGWLGGYQEQFIMYSWLLSLAWAVNVMSGPAYFSNVATGKLRWNMIGHTVVGVGNLCAGWLLGATLGGGGVVIGFALALIAGSLTILFAGRAHNENCPTVNLIPKQYRWHAAWTAAMMVAGGVMIASIGGGAVSAHISNLLTALLAVMIAVIYGYHPYAHKLFRMLINR